MSSGTGKEAVEVAQYHIQAQEVLGGLDGALSRLEELACEIEGTNTDEPKEEASPNECLSSFLKGLPEYLQQRKARVVNATVKLRELLLAKG